MRKFAVGKVAFRTDASLDIGTGHVMRCLTLAEALRNKGSECHFICRQHEGNLIEKISQRGFSVSELPRCERVKSVVQDGNEPEPFHAAWLGCDWKVDSTQTAEILKAIMPDWLVLDHYSLDIRWEDALRGHFNKLMVIDDLADRPHSCDLLLDQNLGRSMDHYAKYVPDFCTILAGPHYALLRPEFAALREYSLRRRENPSLKRLLITMGGVDKPNATCQMLEALKACPLPSDCQIVVVMGAHAPWLAQVRQLAADMPWSTEVRVNISDMAKLMADSDLAIGAAGSTSWERCCLGLPSLLVVLAENQRVTATILENEQVVVTMQLCEELNKVLFENIKNMLERKTVMMTMTKHAANVTDGLGCERVLKWLSKQ